MYGTPTHFSCECNFVMSANHGEPGAVARGMRRCEPTGIRGHSGDAGVQGFTVPALVGRLDLVSEPVSVATDNQHDPGPSGKPAKSSSTVS
jgi:hypothetical protein